MLDYLMPSAGNADKQGQQRRRGSHPASSRVGENVCKTTNGRAHSGRKSMQAAAKSKLTAAPVPIGPTRRNQAIDGKEQWPMESDCGPISSDSLLHNATSRCRAARQREQDSEGAEGEATSVMRHVLAARSRRGAANTIHQSARGGTPPLGKASVPGQARKIRSPSTRQEPVRASSPGRNSKRSRLAPPASCQLLMGAARNASPHSPQPRLEERGWHDR